MVNTCLGLALRLRPLLVITLDQAAEAVSMVKCVLFEMACVGWGRFFSWISFFCPGLPSSLGLRGLVLWSGFAVPGGAVMFTSVFSPCPPILCLRVDGISLLFVLDVAMTSIV